MLQIRLLGQFDIRMDGKRVTIPSRAGQSLLAYLTLTAGTAHRREKLAGILWPDITDENARKNLRQELWRIRKGISTQQTTQSEYLIADEITLKFNRESEYWLDVSQMERPDLDLHSLISNLSLYQGELLPGFYDEWITLERERVQAVFEARMEGLLEQLITAERWIAVQEWGERWLTLSGAREPAYRALMLASGMRGDLGKVTSLYKRCADELMEQLGVEPSTETRKLYEGLIKSAKTPLRPSAAQPSGTITFLFTDIEGSTHLLERMGDHYAVALSEHHEILRASIQKWNGREVDTQGDAFFVTFTRAIDAAQCAAEAQRALAAHRWHEGEHLQVRMGLHTGEPLIASTGYVGMDVHRAARIGDAGHGGQILLSQTTRELVVQDLPEGMTIRDLGEHRLKDMKYPSNIYQLVVEGLPADFAPIRTKFTGTEAPTPGEAPFKGLEYFDINDSDLFFGREVLTTKLVHRLRDANFLSVIIGASGSGKSSLVRAGLVPSIRKGNSSWQVHILTPTAHPLEALAIELTRNTESVTAAATLADDLSKDPRSLHFFLSRQTQTNDSSHTLLVIDQFEELFTLCRDNFEREAFIDNLLTALTPPTLPLGEARRGEGNITLVITLRADFYAHLAQYPDLRDAVAQQQEYIGPMTMEELRRAIEEPARGGHWEFEPGLVDLILRDVGDEPGALPLLSHALLETWKRRAGHVLTLKGYADAGGVHGAIAHTAESVYQNLSLREQVIMRYVLLRLTEFGEGTEDTRRRASFDELMSSAQDADEVRAVLNKLAEARLVTLSEDQAEVAHEALIREWPQLREWLSQDREGILLHRHLTEAAQEWELLERDTDSLFRGARLAQANEWSALNPNALNARERIFLDSSNMQAKQEKQEHEDQLQRELDAAKKLADTEHRSAKQLPRRALYLAGVLTLTIMATFIAGFFAYRANVNFTHSEAERLAAEANNLMLTQGDTNLIALLTIRSLNMDYTPTGDAVLADVTTLELPPRELRGHLSDVWGADFSPDGKVLATGGSDNTIRLWDLATGETIRIISDDTSSVEEIAFSPDGNYIVAAGWEGTTDNDVSLFSVTSGQVVRVFSGHSAAVSDVIFFPDGKSVVSGGVDSTARIWDVSTGQTLHILTGHSDDITRMAVSPDGKYVVTGSLDRTARLWDAVTGKEVRIFNHPDVVSAVAYSPDGKYFATGCEDLVTRLWEASTGQVVREFLGGEVLGIEFSPDGRFLLTGGSDRIALLWDLATGETIRSFTGHTSSIQTVTFSPDGHQIATTSNDRIVRVWSLQSASMGMQFVGHKAMVFQASFSPDAKYIVTASIDNSARIWNTLTGQTIITLIEHKNEVRGAVFSPDGETVLTSSADGTARLWEVASGKELLRLEGHTDAVNRAVFSPDGEYVVTASWDGTARVWDPQTGETKVIYINQGPERVNRVVFSPDGKTVATSGDDGTARIWDPLSGEDLMIFKGHTDRVTGVAFSPDGKYLVTCSFDSTVRLWEVSSGKEIRRFAGHRNGSFSAAFSPDGKFVLTSSGRDATARLWDVTTGREVRRFTGPITSATFSPDGKYILTGSEDGTARLWLTSLDETIRAVCALLTRDLTPDERIQFGIADQGPTCPAE